MFGSEHREILPRTVNPALVVEHSAAPGAQAAVSAALRDVDAIIVGRSSIMDDALQAAMTCLPPGIQQKLNSCAPQGGGCAQLQKTYVSQTEAQGDTGGTVTFNTFQKPFKLAKLSITAADADAVTISAINVAGQNLLVNGSMNGGVASTANEDGGVAIDGDWVYPGNTITIVYTSTALSAPTAFTLGGLTTP